MRAEDSRLDQYLPQEIKGWRAEEDRLLNHETIFDYINGAGEVYKAYNFTELLARRFIKEGSPDIIVDFFDMGSPANAFGVFTHDMDGEELEIGQGANYRAGLLSFWKDRFFVSIYTVRETEETKEAIIDIGSYISSAVPEEGKKPALAGLMPEAFSRHRNISYFYNHFILNYHFFVAVDNIFMLGSDTEAVISSSRADETRLLIIRYPDAEKASQARINFLEAYMPDAAVPGIIQTEDKKWTVARIKDNLLITVFHAASEPVAEDIISEVFAKLTEQEGT